MRLARSVAGISKVTLLLLMLISFVLGATFSYIFTVGFYAPGEFNLPTKPNIAVEGLPEFFAENATFFNVTVLNPSYSTSDVTIEKVKIETADGKLHDAITPYPSQTLIPTGGSRTFKALWNWGNYTGQTLRVHVIPSEGVGSNIEAATPFMNFTFPNIDFDPSLTVEHFNITVRNAGSSAVVNMINITVDGEEVSTEPSLTTIAGLTNASDGTPVELELKRNWVDLQGKDVTLAVQTLQGYTFYKTIRSPGPVTLSIDRQLVVFNSTYTDHFNMSIINERSVAGHVNITEVSVDVFVNGALDRTVSLNSTSLDAHPSATIDLSVPLGITRLTCRWDWQDYLGRGATATITVRTLQGFATPPLSDINIP